MVDSREKREKAKRRTLFETMGEHIRNVNSFALLYTVEGSEDHGVLFFNPFDSYDEIVDQLMEKIRDEDGWNNNDYAGKTDVLDSMTVIWDQRSQDSGWPAKTEVSSWNHEPILRILRDRLQAGKDDRLHILLVPLHS